MPTDSPFQQKQKLCSKFMSYVCFFTNNVIRGSFQSGCKDILIHIVSVADMEILSISVINTKTNMIKLNSLYHGGAT